MICNPVTLNKAWNVPTDGDTYLDIVTTNEDSKFKFNDQLNNSVAIYKDKNDGCKFTVYNGLAGASGRTDEYSKQYLDKLAANSHYYAYSYIDSLPTKPGVYRLSNNLHADGVYYLDSNQTIIDLNGYSFDKTSDGVIANTFTNNLKILNSYFDGSYEWSCDAAIQELKDDKILFDAQQWNDPSSMPTESGYYILNNDIKVKGQWQLPTGTKYDKKKFIIGFNDHSISSTNPYYQDCLYWDTSLTKLYVPRSLQYYGYVTDEANL